MKRLPASQPRKRCSVLAPNCSDTARCRIPMLSSAESSKAKEIVRQRATGPSDFFNEPGKFFNERSDFFNGSLRNHVFPTASFNEAIKSFIKPLIFINGDSDFMQMPGNSLFLPKHSLLRS